MKLVEQFLEDRSNFLANEADKPKRIYQIADAVGINSFESFSHNVIHHVKKLHETNHVIDPATGVKVSIGLVHIPWVKHAIPFTEFLTTQSDNDYEIRVLAYHAQHPLYIRHYIEQQLNKALVRKDPTHLFNVDYIQSAIKDSGKKNVIFVLVATAVEVVGKDHDFDWAVTEPTTWRHIIQLAGRILRHRDVYVTEPNIIIMPMSISTFNENYRVGIEDMLVEVGGNCTGVIDARGRIDNTMINTLPIATAENDEIGNVFKYVDKPIASAKKDVHAYSDARSGHFLTTATQHCHPFRKSEKTVNLAYDPTKGIFGEVIWTKQKGLHIVDTVEYQVEIKESQNTTSFWFKIDAIQLADDFTNALAESSGRYVTDFSAKYGTLSVRCHDGDSVNKFTYNPQLGLLPIKTK